MKSCCICGENPKFPPKELYRIPNNRVLECSRCGLVYVEKEVLTEKVIDYYRNQETIYKSQHAQFDRIFTERIRQIEQWHNTSGKMILDIGCGFGYFLNVARKNGWTGFGIDMSHYAAEYGNKEFGLQIQVATVTSAQFSPAYFDVITLFNLIEHLSEPVPTIKKIVEWLKPNGLLVLETPSEDSLIHQMHRFAYKISRGKISYAGLIFGTRLGHLYGFNPMNLQILLNQIGLTPIYIGRTESPFLILLKKNNRGKPIFRKIINFLILSIFYCFAAIVHRQNRVIIFALKSAMISKGN